MAPAFASESASLLPFRCAIEELPYFISASVACPFIQVMRMCFGLAFSLLLTLAQRSKLSLSEFVLSPARSFCVAITNPKLSEYMCMGHLACSTATTIANSSALGLVCACPLWFIAVLRG